MTGGERRKRSPLRRGAYLLPSLFTIGNIFLGFYAIVCGLRGDFSRATAAIFIAAILDGLDGRIARLAGTESDFGREYDSLADALTFGAAPAVLTYLMVTDQVFGRLGWLVPLFYLVCTATRLARYNVQTQIVDSRYFVGLPAPAAACFLGAVMLFAVEWELPVLTGLPLLASALVVGVLMVSTFRYPSFKRFDLRRRWSYRMALPLAASLIVIGVDPPAFFLGFGTLFVGWPPLAWTLEQLGLRRRGAGQATDEPGEEGIR
jgi:CDP-diacylglycerol--serine O-phosphatidyltransferase